MGLELDGRRIARQHARLLAGDRQIGEITSGTMSPTLNKNIAMALVSTEVAAEGTELQVDINGRWATARVVKLPFYKRPKTV